MIKVEKVQVDNGQSTVINFTLGVEESLLLDSIISKLLLEPFNEEFGEEEIRLDLDESIFLSNFARHIGSSGVRQYIENATVTKTEVITDEEFIDYSWQPTLLTAFEENKNSKKYNKDEIKL